MSLQPPNFFEAAMPNEIQHGKNHAANQAKRERRRRRRREAEEEAFIFPEAQSDYKREFDRLIEQMLAEKPETDARVRNVLEMLEKPPEPTTPELLLNILPPATMLLFSLHTLYTSYQLFYNRNSSDLFYRLLIDSALQFWYACTTYQVCSEESPAIRVIFWALVGGILCEGMVGGLWYLAKGVVGF